MEKYMPDMYQKSIHTINYDKLMERGIKCLLFDLDNTIIAIKENEAGPKVINLFNQLKEKGFKVFLFSNAFETKVKKYKDELKVEGYSFARKPSPNMFNKLMKEQKFTISELAIIGDQLITDIKGGNKVGITTILVNPISKKELIFTKMNRLIEGDIYKKLGKNNLLVKGKYYE